MTVAPSPTRSASVHLPVSLAFSAGFVDTLGFIALFGFFTAHVTGNFVLLGAALVQPHHGVIAKLLALPVFIASVAATRIYERSLIRRKLNVAPRLLTAEFLCLLAFTALGLLATPLTDADALIATVVALSGVVAMSIQNAMSRTVFTTLSPTTVMTGNVTQLVIDGVDLVAGVHDEAAQAIRSRMGRFWPPVVAFAAGAAAGAAGFAIAGFAALALPTVLVFVLAVQAGR